MNNILSQLNQEQLLSVKHIHTPLLIIAGAGSGKTKVITTKIAYLIKECNFNPKNITAITFTNKSAHEMLERTNLLLKTAQIDGKGLTVTTFHSLGLRILKSECGALNLKSSFSILDSYDTLKIISDISKAHDKPFIKKIQSQISLWKNQLLNPQQVLSQVTDGLEKEMAQIYSSYDATLKAYHAVDFDDLIYLPYMLFNTNQEVLYKWQQKIRYLLIDEYQDTNTCQYQLVKLLIMRSKMLSAVGDDDQSIYAWRGANVTNLENLQTDFKDLTVIKLEQNYRSTTTILNAANNIIKNNIKLFNKNLWSKLGTGNQINIIPCKNDEIEANTIISKLNIHNIKNNTKYSNYVVLYRSNHQARLIEQALRNHHIPYIISGGQSFFEKAEIKDITAYLRLIVNDDDDAAFIRSVTTPKRGIGQKAIEKLANYVSVRKISMFAGIF